MYEPRIADVRHARVKHTCAERGCRLGVTGAGTRHGGVGVDDRYWINMFATLAMYPISFLLSFSVLALLPNYESELRRCGERTLVPYVFHSFFLMTLEALTYLATDYTASHVIPLFIIMYIFVAVMYLVPRVREALKLVILPPIRRWGWLKPHAA